ncbi:MAG: hypothetical protein PHE77_01630 [Candidatus Pacebacteria bacterium]|nr:hypothetical protein [Candidatus Paceibacterota bacterium]
MSTVFEFHFNPRIKQEQAVFETFCFLPQTLFEKKQGFLYITTEIKNPGPQSQKILTDVAEIIKKYFYQKPILASHDSFQLALNQANDYLSQWHGQGDLHFASVAVGPKCNIKVSKTGNIKIILFRNQEAFDIGSNFTNQPLSGKIFPDVIEGSLQKNDRLLLATSEVFQSLQAEKILDDLALCYEAKLIKQVFKAKKKIVREFSGACLLAFVKNRPIISFLSRF